DGDYAHGGWAMPYFDTAIGEAIVAAQGRNFDLLLGRRTYDIFAGYWPKVENDPIADGLNAATKYVATHRPDNLGWGPVEDLGRGKRFCSDSADPRELALVSTKAASSGVLMNTYRHVGSLRTK